MSVLATRKIMLALPVLAVLLLARCASPESGSNDASNSNITPEQIRQALEMMQSQSGTATNGEYGAEEIKAAMRKHIARRTRLGNPGVFEITDPRTSQVLQLEFQKIHDPVRTLGGGFYFACTNFAALGEPGKTYDLDFWIQPHGGELVVYQENVHKLPVRKDGKWSQQPRYTFVDDRVSLLR
jgi:hypothetical protein